MKNQRKQSLLNSKECQFRIWQHNCWLSQHLMTKKHQKKKRNCNQKPQVLQIQTTHLLFRIKNLKIPIVKKARVKKSISNQTCSVLNKRNQGKRRQMMRKQMLIRLENQRCFICHKSNQTKKLDRIQRRNRRKMRRKRVEKVYKSS